MLKKLARWVRAPSGGPHGARAAILDEYVRTAPSAQNALDVFKGEWWSAMPAGFAGQRAGQLPVFDDPRIKFAVQGLGGIAGKTILELGPLEAGHTYMLEQAGALSIVAIEANTRAFLKCLIVKEVVGLGRSRFLLGDFEEYLRDAPQRFDAVIASGVIYHLRRPVELIQNLACVTDRVYVWTHYHDAGRIGKIAHMKHRFGATEEAEQGGFSHTLHRYNYGDFLETTRFAGGSEQFSNWLSRDDLLGALRHAGFNHIDIGDEELEHTNGPCISLVAMRRP